MTNYPTYRSPIRLLKELGLNPSEITSERLKMERKRLLLEIQMSEDQTVKIGNKNFTKNDVINIIEEVSSITNLNYHQQIFNYPILLNLLENNKIKGTILNQDKIRFESPEERQKFNDFISPFLANSIDKVTSEIIQNNTFLKLNALTNFFRMLNLVDGIYAFRKFNNFCLSLDDRIKRMQSDQSTFPVYELLYIRYYPFYDTVNEAKHFYPQLADKVATSLVNFTVSYQKSEGRADHLAKISEHMLRLNCSEDIKGIIRKNSEIFRRQIEVYTPVKKGTPLLVFIIALIVAFTVIFAIKSGVSGAGNSNSADSTDPIEELRKRLNGFNHQRTITYISQVERTDFDLDAFKLFHDSTYLRVTTKTFSENDFTWDGTPEVRSPLVISDSMNGRPHGRKVQFLNDTESEILMVIRDKNVLCSYYTPSKSSITVAIDPKSHVFFYSGKDWNDDRTITYRHKYPNIMTDGMTIRYTGSFNETEEINHRFLDKIYFLNHGSIETLKIQEIDGEYVFLSGNAQIPTPSI